MSYEDLMNELNEFHKEEEAWKRGEVEDDLSPEARQNWKDRCNSQY